MSLQMITTGQTPPALGIVEGGEWPARQCRLRIAIVEDEAMVAWALESMAEDLGHEIVGTFATGEAALASLGEDPPELVLMDINLGDGIDGIETAARLRSQRPVAILFISAYSDPDTRARALAAVPDALLVGKPIQAATLGAAIAGLAAGVPKV